MLDIAGQPQGKHQYEYIDAFQKLGFRGLVAESFIRSSSGSASTEEFQHAGAPSGRCETLSFLRLSPSTVLSLPIGPVHISVCCNRPNERYAAWEVVGTFLQV
ncbi:hypothetical protein [Bradyrhizobium sp. 5.13L]